MLASLYGCPLISPENYERFCATSKIDSADREMKQKTEDTLKNIADNYRKLLSDRLAHELGMVDEAKATGNAAATNHHKVLAEVYRSCLSGQAVQAGKQGL